MSYAEFRDWYHDFANRNGGRIPTNLNAWYRRVEANHDHIRELMGGYGITLKIEFNEEDSTPLALDQWINIAHTLAHQMGKQFTQSEWEFLKNATVRIGSKKTKAITTQKYVIGLAERAKVSFFNMENIERELNKLVVLHKNNAPSKYQGYLTISTHPMAFCMLGSYGCDNASCWKQSPSAINQDRKFTFGGEQDTCVILFTTDKPKSFEDIPKACHMRVLGFIPRKVQYAFNTFSNYSVLADKPSEADVTASIKKMCQNIFHFDNVSFARGNFTVGGSGLYCNNSLWTFYDTNIHTQKKDSPRDYDLIAASAAVELT